MTINFPHSDLQRINILAKLYETSPTDIIRKIIHVYVKKHLSGENILSLIQSGDLQINKISLGVNDGE